MNNVLATLRIHYKPTWQSCKSQCNRLLAVSFLYLHTLQVLLIAARRCKVALVDRYRLWDILGIWMGFFGGRHAVNLCLEHVVSKCFGRVGQLLLSQTLVDSIAKARSHLSWLSELCP